MTILSTKCEHCIYGTIDETNKAKIKIHCSIKDKDYYYGQYIPCDYFESNGDIIEDEENTTTEDNVEQIKPEKKKRGRGRPKGSKNKKK